MTRVSPPRMSCGVTRSGWWCPSAVRMLTSGSLVADGSPYRITIIAPSILLSSPTAVQPVVEPASEYVIELLGPEHCYKFQKQRRQSYSRIFSSPTQSSSELGSPSSADGLPEELPDPLSRQSCLPMTETIYCGSSDRCVLVRFSAFPALEVSQREGTSGRE